MRTQRRIGENFISNDHRDPLHRSERSKRFKFERNRLKLAGVARISPLVAGLVFALAQIEKVSGAAATFTWNNVTSGAVWLNSANWTGGPPGKAPGVDNNSSSTIDNDPNDNATFAT